MICTTGLLTAGRNPGDRTDPGGQNGPQLPDVDDQRVITPVRRTAAQALSPRWVFLPKCPPQAPPGCPLRALHAPGTPLPRQSGRRQDGLHGVIRQRRSLSGRPRRFWRGGPATVSRTTIDSVHETSSAARWAAPDGGHRLPHRGKTGTPSHQGREVFGDALDAQPHGNPDKGGGNHPELPCNRSGGGRVLLIATEAGNEEQSGPRRKCMGTNRN